MTELTDYPSSYPPCPECSTHYYPDVDKRKHAVLVPLSDGNMGETFHRWKCTACGYEVKY